MSKFKHKFMLKLNNKKQGFSLIELLVTISIIGILAAVAVPAYQSYTDKAKLGVSESILRQAIRNIQLNQELGDDSNHTNIAASIKSKGKKIPSIGIGALIIADAGVAATGTVSAIVGVANKVNKNAKKYCASVTATDTYPAACIQIDDGTIKINPLSGGVKQIICTPVTGICD